MKSHSRPRWSGAFEHRLSAYSFVAGVALASAGTAQADIIYTNVDQTIHPNASLYIDLNHDGRNDFQIRDFGGSLGGFGFERVTVLPDLGNGAAVGRFYRPLALNQGDTVGGNLNFGTYGALAELSSTPVGGGEYGYFLNTRGKFLGLRFSLNGETFYGWARVNVLNRRTGFATTLVDYAYEDVPDQPIIAGSGGASVPEPATLGLLALGAAGVALWRKTTNNAADKA